MRLRSPWQKRTVWSRDRRFPLCRQLRNGRFDTRKSHLKTQSGWKKTRRKTGHELSLFGKRPLSYFFFFLFRNRRYTRAPLQAKIRKIHMAVAVWSRIDCASKWRWSKIPPSERHPFRFFRKHWYKKIEQNSTRNYTGRSLFNQKYNLQSPRCRWILIL